MQDLRWRYITDVEILLVEISLINANCKFVVCDTETTGKNAHTTTLVDIQISSPRHDKEVLIFPAALAHLLREIKIPFVWQNMKYDLIVLNRHGVDLRNKIHWDTMLIEHLLDENMWSYSLPALIEKHCGAEVEYKGDFWKKYTSYLDAPFEERMQYGAQDIYWTGFVYKSQQYMIKEGSLEF